MIKDQNGPVSLLQCQFFPRRTAPASTSMATPCPRVPCTCAPKAMIWCVLISSTPLGPRSAATPPSAPSIAGSRPKANAVTSRSVTAWQASPPGLRRLENRSPLRRSALPLGESRRRPVVNDDSRRSQRRSVVNDDTRRSQRRSVVNDDTRRSRRALSTTTPGDPSAVQHPLATTKPWATNGTCPRRSGHHGQVHRRACGRSCQAGDTAAHNHAAQGGLCILASTGDHGTGA